MNNNIEITSDLVEDSKFLIRLTPLTGGMALTRSGSKNRRAIFLEFYSFTDDTKVIAHESPILFKFLN
jgi:hypothetical protein